jgi:hypothetical protein
MDSELELLRRLHREVLTEDALLDIFYANRDRYRVLLHLLQQPRFPERQSLNIIPRLYPMDLIRVIKNKRTNPYIRKRCEFEFVNKYQKYPVGEKLSYMKVAPNSLLNHFISEQDVRVLEVILNNPNCTEEILLKMVNRVQSRHNIYQVLVETEWYKRPQVAIAIANDTEASIRILMLIIPYLGIKQLETLYTNPDTHVNVKNNIIQYMKQR